MLKNPNIARLIQAKSLINHGHWQAWLQNNFQLSYRTAKNFMDCAERYGKTEINFTLNSTQMIALLSLPDAEETEKFIAEKAAENLCGGEMLINVGNRRLKMKKRFSI